MKKLEPLQIPLRFRRLKDGMYIRCNKRKVNVTDKCCLSGKKLYTCKNADHHRFLSLKYSEEKKRMVYLKSWPKELRDFNEFRKLHLELITSSDNKRKTINEKPAFLTDCIKLYAAYIKDIGTPSYEKKNNTSKYTKNEINHLKNIKEALASKQINTDLLMITDFQKKHVEIIYNYLSEKFSNKSLNHRIDTYRRLFKFLTEKEYPISNPFQNVKKLPTSAKKEVVTYDEFKQLIKVVTPEAGIKMEVEKSEKSKRIRRRNLYTDYLVDGWSFMLFTGCRYEELQQIKVKDIKEDFIKSKDHKASKLKRQEVIRFIPMITELKELCDNLVKGRSDNDFLIAPDEKNRSNVTRILSSAFTHYWKLVSNRDDVTFYSLKNSYSTQAIKKFGTTNIHQDINTTMKNYVNDIEIVKNQSGINLYG